MMERVPNRRGRSGRIAEDIKRRERPIATAQACNLRMGLMTWGMIGELVGISSGAASLYAQTALPFLNRELRTIAKMRLDGWRVDVDGNLRLWLHRPAQEPVALRCYQAVEAKYKYRHLPLPPAIRARVVARAEGLCEDCGAEGVHAHHVKARALGGTDDLANLRLLCFNCHLDEGWYRNHRELIEAGLAPADPLFKARGWAGGVRDARVTHGGRCARR